MFAPAQQTDQLSRLLNKQIAIQCDRLLEQGDVFEANTDASRYGVALSCGSDSGAKRSNQDSALFWLPQHPSPLRWVAAVADGVTASLHSEGGSRLASHAAISAVLLGYERNNQAARPLRLCLKYFQKLGKYVQAEAGFYHPPDVTKSSWKRILRDGRFAQTTLTVAWEDERGLKIEGVGDGGFVVGTEPGESTVLNLPTSDRPVHCLGPNTTVVEPECRFEFSRWDSLALFTDGLTPIVQRLGSDFLQLSSGTNGAKFIKSMTHDYADHIDDNLTLLTARKLMQ